MASLRAAFALDEEACRRRRIYVVDDNPVLQDAIVDRLRNHLGEESAANVEFWRTTFVWEVTDAAPGDIALCDLLPAGYWRKAPFPRLYSQADPMTDDVENVFRASLDLLQRYMRPLQNAGVQVIVTTRVPAALRERDREDRAVFLIDALRAQGLAGVFEKRDRSPNLHNFDPACEQAVALLKELVPQW